MSEQQKQQLERRLWNIADILRGKMDADDFRDYILGFIFYKYLSERIEIYADEALQYDQLKFLEINDSLENHEAYLKAVREAAVSELGYFLRPDQLFSQIVQKGQQKDDNFILEDLTQILKSIEDSTRGSESEEEFIGLFEDLDLKNSKLGRSEADKNKIILQIMLELDKVDFDLKNADSDILGDAYEYLIGQFASGAGKKAGEFYTPQQVSKILAKIVALGKSQLQSVYDPTCGSGSLLLRVAKEVKQIGKYYGQELNRTTFNLARMNMILHGIHYKDFDLRQEDTLERPQHPELLAEAVLANPPFSAKWSANQTFNQDDRFAQYGKLAPSSKADFAFIQHMIFHLAENGTMAVVTPHGVLFRGAAEGQIRQYLIQEKNYLDAVIGLPANIFYGTSIPTAILVFKKCRENPDHILFIDASQHFEKAKNQNYLRDADVDKIIRTYQSRQAEDKYSYAATLDEIAENDYNLNIPRYVDTFEEEAPIDLGEVSQKIKSINQELNENAQRIEAFCKELGIDNPFA